MKKALLLLLFNSAIYAQSDLTLCDNNQDGFQVFDITVIEQEILNQLPQGDYTLSYHTTYEDAGDTVNEISSPQAYTNTTPYSQTVYARVSSEGNYTIFDFNLIVNPTPIANSIILHVNDVDENPNDGAYSVPYETLAAPIIEQNPDIDIEIGFYTDAALTSWFDTPYPVTDSTTFYYQVTNIDTGCSWVNIMQVNIDATASVKENIFSDLQYSNPVNNKLTIKSTVTIDSIFIFNSLGQVVYSQNINDEFIETDVTGFSNGIYFVKLSSGSASKTIKVVKE